MKLSYIFVFVVILCMVMPTMATPTISGGIPTFNASINVTFVTIAGVMNQTANMTANMTAGNAATINVNATFTGLPGTLADVVNIGTVSAALLDFTIPAGSSGSSVDTSQFYFINTTRSLTGEKITRDVDNDLLSLYGGNAIAGGTGIISLYGKTSANPNDVEVVAGDGGVGNTLITSWRGGANPVMDMNGWNITGIKTITNASDATNKSYVDMAIAGVSGGSTNLSAVYPIGSVYISTLSTDPKITFEGFGCWTSVGTGYVII